MATKTFKIGLSNTDKQNMAQDVYERLLALTFPEYDTTTEYEVGDFVVYNDQLYKCIGATTGAWDSSKWQLATLNDLLTDIEDAVQFVNDKANVDGNYPTMTVGVADQLSPYDDQSGDDQDEPFSFQATGTGNGTQPDFSTGSIALMKEKQGNTVVVNQVFNFSNFPSTQTINGITFTNNGDGSITVSGLATADAYITYTNNDFSAKAGNKVLLFGCPSGGSNSTYYLYARASSGAAALSIADTGNGVVGQSAANLSGFFIYIVSGTDMGTGKVFKPRLVDLTQWFNGDIPSDIIANPSNFFRYYQGSLAYNEGELVNANSRYIKCIGMNQWDEANEIGRYNTTTGEKESGNNLRNTNFIQVIPNAKYYFKAIAVMVICQYDKAKNFIGVIYAQNEVKTISANCVYINFMMAAGYGTTYNNDISINLYYEDEPRCLTYEPYEVLTNNDTGTEILRKAGSVKDSKAPDGTITRKVGYVDLGSLTWSYISGDNARFVAQVSGIKEVAEGSGVANILCAKYEKDTFSNVFYHSKDKIIGLASNSDSIGIYDTAYNDAVTFKTAMSGVYLFYELAEPTTEQGTPFSENLVIDDFGSMDFQGTNGVPQGNLIFYPVDYKAFIDTLYDYTTGTPSNIALKSDLPTAPQTWAESLPGYDATKTQTLKNVNGTLTWVTEE